MIKLMKYTYLLENDKIKRELDEMYKKYDNFLIRAEETWRELNEARAILYLTGQVYCEEIVPEAIQHRLHLLKNPITLGEFLQMVDSKPEKIKELREDKLFIKLEEFYEIIKEYKNKCTDGKFYLNEEKFIQLYNFFTRKEKTKIGYKGKFDDESLNFMN